MSAEEMERHWQDFAEALLQQMREVSPECRPYYCPTSGETECCSRHGGWDVCCDAPEKHRGIVEVLQDFRTDMEVPGER